MASSSDTDCKVVFILINCSKGRFYNKFYRPVTLSSTGSSFLTELFICIILSSSSIHVRPSLCYWGLRSSHGLGILRWGVSSLTSSSDKVISQHEYSGLRLLSNDYLVYLANGPSSSGVFCDFGPSLHVGDVCSGDRGISSFLTKISHVWMLELSSLLVTMS